MIVNKIILIFFWTLVFSSSAFSGGGGPVSIEDRFKRFENPYIGIRESLDKYLLQTMLSESEWYVANLWQVKKPWEDKDDFKTSINQRLIENKRPALISKLKSKHGNMCSNNFTFPWNSYSLLSSPKAIDDKRVISKYFNADLEKARSFWFVLKNRLKKACASGVDLSTKPFEEVINPDDDFLSYFEGTLIYDYTRRLYQFRTNPTVESGRRVIDSNLAKMLRDYGLRLSGYDAIVKQAKEIMESSSATTLVWGGEFPFNKSAKWSSCVGDVAKEAMLEFLDVSSSLSGLSDKNIGAMIIARALIADACENRKNEPIDFTAINNFPAKWSPYFSGLQDFYNKGYELAIQDFERAHKVGVDDQGLSSYMLARSYMSLGDTYNNDSDVKKSLNFQGLDKAFHWYQTHINEGGVYSKSALGMLGRIYFLSDKKELYQNNLRGRLLEAINTGSDLELSIIINEYINYSDVGSLLVDVNKANEFETIAKDNRLKDISKFSNALRLYHEGEYKQSIGLLSDLPFTAVFNLIVETARNIGDVDTEIFAINKYLKGNTKALYLSELKYRDKGVSAFYSTKNSKLIEGVASSICSPKELEKSVREYSSYKGIESANRVLYKSLLISQKFDDLNRLFNDPEFPLEDYKLIRTAVRQIANRESLGRAYMNVGYFLNVKEKEESDGPINKFLGGLHPKKFCSDSLVSGAVGPKHFYNLSIKEFELDAHSIHEAKALSFMVNCDRPGKKGCWGYRPSEAEDSKVLYERLHSKYKGSTWAKKTPHYFNSY